ncbi:MAG: response regulator, partial [Pseudomonadota bacterium]
MHNYIDIDRVLKYMSINPTILIVDDSAENIDLLSNMLHDNYKVKAALYGERALKIAKATPHPDMILLDIMMPGMDGYEVCKSLKDDPLTSQIPVIFISAMN